MSDAVIVEALVKTFGTTRALDGLDLAVPEGSVLGLLGPNGAGKTTAVRVLSTLLSADSGRAEVCGVDVHKEPNRVRRLIGLTGQFAAIDENLTGRENLVLFGRLYHLGKSTATKRADELLERFELTEAATRVAKTYSGGMRRRLDIAASLIARPQVLFLDEPTTGLDPRSRLGMWDVIQDLVRDGTTMLLTTQYLEEADVLASSIAVIDAGKVIARGTSDELKAQVGGARIELVVDSPAHIAVATTVLADLGDGAPSVDAASLTLAVPVTAGAGVLAELVRRLDFDGVGITDLAIRRPTLDDVFLRLTGHVAEEKPDTEALVATAARGGHR
ncbi:MAG TPA: ATP-binding cassette domain-containing protein [Jatrophihabitantaceae bacterium]|nr:ATP-binding cassette domain-containing protein [Jatrophihabitantaceae bacterium]